MSEFYNDIDDKSREAAQNILIAFDENAWKKMEALLDEDDFDSAALLLPTATNSSTAGTKGEKKQRWYFLLFIGLLLFTGAVILSYNKYTVKKTNTVLLHDAPALSEKSNYINHMPAATPHANGGQKKEAVQTLKKRAEPNKNFNTRATKPANEPLTFITVRVKNKLKMKGKREGINKSYTDKTGASLIVTKSKHVTDEKMPAENVKSNIKSLQHNAGNERAEENPETIVLKKEDSTIKATSITIPVTDSANNNVPVVAKAKKTSVTNKFFHKIGFTAFLSPETNTVKLREAGKLTAGYGIGVQYNLGKHITLMASFTTARKIYVTDRNGYEPPAGSPFILIDTLTVNGNCKVWDIPVNVRYSFIDNSKNNFFVSAGISSYIMRKEVYDFSYYEQGVYKTRQRTFTNENKHTFSNLNLSLGYQYWLGKKWSVGFEPYLKLPVSGVGAGKIKLTSAGTMFSLTFKPW